MQSTQSRFLEMLETKMTAYHLECAHNAVLGNTGRVLIYRPGHSVAIGIVSYAFEEDGYTLILKINGKPAPGQTGRMDGLFHQTYDEPTCFWEILGKAIRPSGKLGKTILSCSEA